MAYPFRRCCDTPASSKHAHLRGCPVGARLAEADAMMAEIAEDKVRLARKAEQAADIYRPFNSDKADAAMEQAEELACG